VLEVNLTAASRRVVISCRTIAARTSPPR